MYDPPPREQDADKDSVVDTLTGKAYDDRPQDRTFWTIEGRNVSKRRSVWREHAETLDLASQPIVCEDGTLSGTLSTDGSTATGTWGDGGRS